MTLEKVWITKWALTRGILVAENVECSDTGGSILVTQGRSSVRFVGRDWHQSEARAVLRVMEMVTEKRKATAKQLEQLALLETSYDAGRYKVDRYLVDTTS